MFRRLFVAVFLFCLPISAFAKGPLETLKTAQGKLDTTLQSAPEKGSTEAKKRRATLEAEAKKLFDFETLAQKALNKNWELGSAEQQQEFVSLFSELVRDKYLDQIEGNSSKGFVINWGSESITGDNAIVNATVSGKTAEGKEVNIKMVYKMISRSSSWMVYDVVTDDSSLLDTYKDSFNKMFKKEGSFDGVLQKLRAKTGRKAPEPKAEVKPEVAPVVQPVVVKEPKAEVKATPKPVKAEKQTPKENVIGLLIYKLPTSILFSATKMVPYRTALANTIIFKIFSGLNIFTVMPKKNI